MRRSGLPLLPTPQMNLGARGKTLIQEYEQCRLEAYLPTPDDVWTCGWGSTEGVTEGTVWTQDEADAAFDKDVARFEDCVNDCVNVELTQNQFDALVSLAFNIGCKAFKDSTLVKMLNNNAYGEAADQFGRWNRQNGKVLNGLTRRRRAERDLFLTEDA